MSAPTQSDAPTHVSPQVIPRPVLNLFSGQTTLVRSGDEWERAGQARLQDHISEGLDVSTGNWVLKLDQAMEYKRPHVVQISVCVSLDYSFYSLCQGFHLQVGDSENTTTTSGYCCRGTN